MPAGDPKPAGGSATLPTAGGRSIDPGSDAPATDPIPLGKQSVAVTVDVQGPASMNLNQKTTLRLIVRNTGTSNAINVKILDTLPDGLEYVSSQPEAYSREGIAPELVDQRAACRLRERHHLDGEAGPDGALRPCREGLVPGREQVAEPGLQADAEGRPGRQHEQCPEGAACRIQDRRDQPRRRALRNVTIRAKLTDGLRHGSGEKSEEQTLELTLPTLAPNQREELDSLEVDAIKGGDQSCTVTATSPDVITDVKDEQDKAQSIKIDQSR